MYFLYRGGTCFGHKWGYFIFTAGHNNNINACSPQIITCPTSLMCKIIVGSTEILPLKKDLIWNRTRAARPQIADDKSADAHFSASLVCFVWKICRGLIRSSVIQKWIYPNPIHMKAHSGLKTLIYGAAAGIDPHRINCSKLPPWYIASPCYRSPPCQFSPFPSRSALCDVGQSSRTALLLLLACLASSSPDLQPPPLCPCAPITFQVH